MPGRSYNPTDYRYDFNGKPTDEELGDWQDYGERMYMKRLGRFPTPDPIIIYGKKYADLSPYQFASNTPIQAIDLDGLEAFYIHGTWANKKPVPVQSISTVKDIVGNTTAFSLKWSGHNVDRARRRAAKQFANLIIDNRDPSQPLTIIGHSHGGNVGIMTANILKKKGYDVNYLITINTPAREYQLDDGITAKHINIYQNGDPIQVLGGDLYNYSDGIKIIHGPAGPIVIPTFNGSVPVMSGEMGPAGRTFEGATNIDVSGGGIHDTHNTPELWENQLNEAVNPKPLNMGVIREMFKLPNMAPIDKTKVVKTAPKFN